jgi:FtsZ-interacting cell division protein YlmF
VTKNDTRQSIEPCKRLACAVSILKAIEEDLRTAYPTADYHDDEHCSEENQEALQTEKAPPKKQVQLKDIQSALSAKSQAGFQQQVKALIKSYGVTKVSDVDPKDYADLLTKAEAIK